MTASASTQLRRTALFEEHQKAGGRLIDFGGWELPVQYTGLMDEHNTCRNAVGLFDVSHMGEVHVEGTSSEAFIDYLVTNDITKLNIKQALYSEMCNHHGGIVDDLLVYRRAKDRFLVVVNASNTDKDFKHMKLIEKEFRTKFPTQTDLTVTNESANYTQIAIQGRHAEKITQTLTKTPLSPIKYYWFDEGTVLNGIPAVLARTGYTGEDGFEVYVPWDRGPEVWRALMEAGKPYGIKPVGLGARDTLRLEMKFPLYGHELSDETNPIAAGVGWTVKLSKKDFVGKAQIIAGKERGFAQQLAALKITGRGVARQGYKVFSANGTQELGTVTSGTHSPSLGYPIALAYLDSKHLAIGTTLTVDIRGTKVAAEVVATPFYKRPY